MRGSAPPSAARSDARAQVFADAEVESSNELLGFAVGAVGIEK